MTGPILNLFHRALTSTGIARARSRSHSRLRRFRQREVFVAQFTGAASLHDSASRCWSLHGVEGLEVRAMLTASSEADFLFDNGVIMGYKGSGGSVVIPSAINSQAVTSIGTRAFLNCKGLTSVTLPHGLTQLGQGAFSECSGLISVSLPSTLTSISDYSFTGCSSLTNVSLPATLTSIGEGAFTRCTSLTNVTLPSSLTSISFIAFGDCSSLTTIAIPVGVTNIPDNLFNNCTSLTSVTLPAGLTSIGAGAFGGCASLTSITLPNSVTSIGSGAFGWCTGLTSITLPSGVTSVEGTFSGCTALKSVSLPAGLTSVGSMTFYGCTALTSIAFLPAGVTSIGELAFSGCTGLTSIALPAGVTSIGDYSFAGCTGLTSIALPSGLASIGRELFRGCVGLASLSLPAGVVSIGPQAFAGCTRLTSIALPSGLKSIGNAAFSRCIGLVSIVVPTGVTSIGDHSFSGCSGLKSISLPAEMASIGDGAFADCTGLTSLTIPNGVMSLGDFTFSNCTGLTSITFPASLTDLRDAFWGCSSLKAALFTGNAPTTPGPVFTPCTKATVYYLPQATGWSNTFAGRPAVAAVVPTKPSVPARVAGYRQVTLSWAAPQSNGGNPISDYVVQYSSNNGTTWTTFSDGISVAQSATVTGLDSSRAYVFRVAAVNGVGAGRYSLASLAVLPQSVPTAPSGLVATAGNGRASLAWAAPSSNGGRAITNYVIQYSDNKGGSWTTFVRPPSAALSTTVTGLTNGTGYVFRIFAVNALGRSVASGTSASVIPITTPGTPTAIRGSVSNGSVVVTWAAPSRNGGVAITDYLIQFSSNKGKTWTTFEDGSSDLRVAAVTGLTGGTTYVFRVAARNVAGWGAFSAPSVALKV